MFDYGATNELNAVATVLSNFIPALYPNAQFYEEGCYVKEENGKPYLVVSPDGSLRNFMDSNVISAIEIKCPMPGKLYSTPVQYMLPKYYVSQVLSEMDCLDVGQLLFISYSKESTAIHQVQFDELLWADICNEIKNLDSSQTPKRLSANMQSLKMKIDTFRKVNVSLIAEVKSKTAKSCEHADEQIGRIFHIQANKEDHPVMLKDAQKLFIRASEAVQVCHKLCCQKANEVLVFLLADLDRIYKSEVPHAFPVAYAFKGYRMTAEAMRKMIQDVLNTLFLKGLYTPVISYDGQWASLAFKAEDGQPLTLVELQKQVYNNVKSRRKCQLTEVMFKMAVVKANTCSELARQTVYAYNNVLKSACISTMPGTKLFRPSSHSCNLLKTYTYKPTRKQNDIDIDDAAVNDTDYVFSSVSEDVLRCLGEDEIQEISEISSVATVDRFCESNNSSNSEFYDLHNTFIENEETEHMTEDNVIETPIIGNDREEETNSSSVNEVTFQNEHLLCNEHFTKMLLCLQADEKYGNKWKNTDICDFEAYLQNSDTIMKKFSKHEMLICMHSIAYIIESANMHFAKSWNKQKLSQFLITACTTKQGEKPETVSRQRRRSPDKLTVLCKRAINKIPKVMLNVITAEHEIVEKIHQWQDKSPFTRITKVGDQNIIWFSCPEYNPGTFSYLFSYLDIHHLITNCRIKVCKDGIPAKGISKHAWIFVAKSDKTKLKVSHVEDLIDKQSDSIARQTFSVEVEEAMSQQYPSEAKFCKLIREFYEAEDEPGLSAYERFDRRMALRDWLLDGVNFCRFPPYGSHIQGIPNIMFQGFLTNIDRRLQLFPYVKCSSYNVRSLGSLEAENLFGQFQDLDPKGSGIVKAEEVPAALETACQLLRVRLLPDRPFHMTLSKQKVYHVHELLAESSVKYTSLYVYPSVVREIEMKDHMFDSKTRAKRKARRKLVNISSPDEAAHGVSGVRQYHKCDESKILAHKRLGIDL